MPQVSYLFERHCHVCTVVHRVRQIFEIIEFEIPFALKLSAVVIMVLIHNNVILLTGASIFVF